MSYPTITAYCKRYPFTDVQASPYNADNTGTVDCAASIEMIKSHQSETGILFFGRGTYRIATDLVIPVGMALRGAGATIIVSDGAVLTVNSPYVSDGGLWFQTETGGQIVFNRGVYGAWEGVSGTGVTVLGTAVNVDYFGAVNDGSADSTAAFQAAIDSFGGSRSGVVYLGAGTYRIDNTLEIPAGVCIVGHGVGTVYKSYGHVGTKIVYNGSGPLFLGVETFESQCFERFVVDVSQNPNAGCCVLDVNRGTNNGNFDFGIYRGTNTTLGTLVYLRGKTAGGTPNAACFFNKIGIRIHGGASSYSSGPAMIVGTDETDCRANANLFLRCYTAGYQGGIQLSGHGNTFLQCNFQQHPQYGIKFQVDAGGVHSNNVINCYFDAFGSGVPCILIENNSVIDVNVFTLVGGSPGITNINPFPVQINDNSTGKSTWSYIGKGLILGGEYDSSVNRHDYSPAVQNSLSDGFLRLYGGPRTNNAADYGGAVYVCGSEVGATANSIGPGNLVFVLNSNLPDTALRVASTADFLNYTKIFEITPAGAIRGLRTTDGPVGTFVLDNGGGTTTSVSNTSVTSASRVFITPTSAGSATAEARVTGVTDGVGFTVTHKASPGSGCTFNYLVVN